MSCCASVAPAASPNGVAKTLESVQDYYGKTLQTSKDLKTSACIAAGRPEKAIRDILTQVPGEVLEKFYGCGSPLPTGITGLRLLDLGSGSGRDCYVAAALVGEQGSVTGIDMTDEQLEVARRHAESYTQTLGYKQPNMKFVKGQIEDLKAAGIPDEAVDMVISNCVVNLSPDKEAVLREAYRVLAPGGEFCFSDVYCNVRLSDAVRKDKVLWGECLAGALYTKDFEFLAKEVGFRDPRVLSTAVIQVHDEDVRSVTGMAEFYSITYRLFKLPGLLDKSGCEDYGQWAQYKGTIPGHLHSYQLDQGHTFLKGKPALVCGNTAAMLGMSWLSQHFEVHGDRSVHYGAFDCSAKPIVGNSGPASATTSCC